MSVTPANQTFRKAVLPVLSELDIYLDLPDQELSSETGFAAWVVFNFNNPTFFISGETVLLEDLPLSSTVDCTFVSSTGQNSPLPDSPSPPPPVNILYQSKFSNPTNPSKGTKSIGGLGGSSMGYGTNPDNTTFPSPGQSEIRWHYALVVEVGVAGRSGTLSGKSYHKFNFISANPANPQTLVYDITA